MTDSAAKRPAAGQVVLGLFIVWQLIFLLLANLQELSPPADAAPASTHPGQWLRAATTGWAGLTLQRQKWGFFREFPLQSTFVTVRATWSGGGEPVVLTLPSSFEPSDPSHFLDLNLFRDRLYNYEAWLSLIYLPWDEQTVAGEDPRFQGYREDRARYWWRPLLACMAWRLGQVVDHPPGLPSEVVLLYRVYDTAPPGEQEWRWRGPFERPLVRWRPRAQRREGYLPLEAYDPKSRTFVEVRALP